MNFPNEAPLIRGEIFGPLSFFMRKEKKRRDLFLSVIFIEAKAS